MTSHKKTLIAGNWKMHLSIAQASLLVQRLHERTQIHRDIEVVLAPTMLQLQPISLQIDHRKFKLAAQNAYYKDEGAFTGEVSFTMLHNLVSYVLIGHSDRRHIFNESLDDITKKVAASYRNNITPILCVGETNIEKLAKETNQVLHDQVVTALANVTSEEVQSLVVAYEPVWALSNGTDYANHKIPTPEEVASAANVIRNNIAELYGANAANSVRILYGGSANPDMAPGYLRIPEIDGLLVGGASLNYHSFSDIVDSAYRVKRNIHTLRDI